jgi:hypothetical protein
MESQLFGITNAVNLESVYELKNAEHDSFLARMKAHYKDIEEQESKRQKQLAIPHKQFKEKWIQQMENGGIYKKKFRQCRHSFKPEIDGGQMNEAQESNIQLVVAGGNPTEVFKLVE